MVNQSNKAVAQKSLETLKFCTWQRKLSGLVIILRGFIMELVMSSIINTLIEVLLIYFFIK